MSKKDLGLGYKHSKSQKRSVNKDGSFNVVRIGGVSGIKDLYQHLITISWFRFLISVVGTYILINGMFALVYFTLCGESLSGLQGNTEFERFLNCFFFSTQTFATVGYGAISPTTITANIVASIESLIGLLAIALATGLLFGRFSKPNAKLLFSENIILSPYKGEVKGLMFRVVNKRNNILLESSAEVILAYDFKDENGNEKRGFNRLNLEISDIKLFPTTWTIVHPVEKDSPFYGLDEKGIKAFPFEILILIKAYDETFGQHVFARTSYTNSEFVYQAKFNKPYYLNAKGETVIDMEEVIGFEKVNYWN